MSEVETMPEVREALGSRSLVLVGLMGCGKSSVGRRLAAKLGLPFVDADEEIEKAAAKSIKEIFADYGEEHFRDREAKVIERLLAGGPQVLATGGGAFMNATTREAIAASGISIWLKAELPVLMRRVLRRDTRPLLKTADPEAVMRGLMERRYPVYALADITVVSRDVPHETIVGEILEAMRAHLSSALDLAREPRPARSSPCERADAVCRARTAESPIRMHHPPADTSQGPLCVVPVALGARSYEVLIGPGQLARAGELIAERFGNARIGIVTDENVARLHLAALEASLKAAGLLAGTIDPLPPGEATKSFRHLEPLCERLLEMGLERGDLAVAFGGGVIGDLVGFAASILRRGVRFVQIPTTLLAQVDSSVGGKTGINTPQGKNLIGTFHQPSLVLADTDVLTTLPVRELKAGYAEVAKYGLLGDARFFGWLEGNWRGVLGNDVAALTHAIEVSVKAKADIVARDETETGDRALLNLGHTFGHALEAWCGYSHRLLHGEGVAIGMAQAFRFSESLALCKPGTARRVEAHLQNIGLPTRVADIPGAKPDADALMRLMAQDKKVRQGRLTFILARAIGEAFITRDIDAAQVRTFLEREVAGM